MISLSTLLQRTTNGCDPVMSMSQLIKYRRLITANAEGLASANKILRKPNQPLVAKKEALADLCIHLSDTEATFRSNILNFS